MKRTLTSLFILLSVGWSYSQLAFSAEDNSFLPTPGAFYLPAAEEADLGFGSFRPFDEVYRFEEGSTVLQVGVGLRSDVVLDNYEKEFMFPALNLLIERSIVKNTGVALILGTQWWDIPSFGFQYRYYNVGGRVAYHINIIDELDPYVAFGVNYKRVVLTDGEGRLFEDKLDYNFILGARYYFLEKLAASAEIGSDNLTWFRIGLALYIE